MITIIMVIKRVNKTAMHEYQNESKRGISNILDEGVYSIMVFKINVLLVLLKEEYSIYFYIFIMCSSIP